MQMTGLGKTASPVITSHNPYRTIFNIYLANDTATKAQLCSQHKYKNSHKIIRLKWDVQSSCIFADFSLKI